MPASHIALSIKHCRILVVLASMASRERVAVLLWCHQRKTCPSAKLLSSLTSRRIPPRARPALVLNKLMLRNTALRRSLRRLAQRVFDDLPQRCGWRVALQLAWHSASLARLVFHCCWVAQVLLLVRLVAHPAGASTATPSTQAHHESGAVCCWPGPLYFRLAHSALLMASSGVWALLPLDSRVSRLHCRLPPLSRVVRCDGALVSRSSDCMPNSEVEESISPRSPSGQDFLLLSHICLLPLACCDRIKSLSCVLQDLGSPLSRVLKGSS